MTTVSRAVSVPYSAQQMFELINDIESYPEFMTGCVGARILSQEEGCVEAKLTLGMSGFQQSFVTRNTLSPPEKMTMKLVDGPFSRFEGVWTFESSDESGKGCKVALNLHFSFSNPLLGMTVGRVIEDIASRQVDSLCQRAEKVYAQSVSE